MTDSTEGALVTSTDAGILAQLNSSEIAQQISTAHAFPRNVKSFRDDVLSLATLTADVAEECSYSLPRKDKQGNAVPIIGPSARFAEIIAMSWGNCHAAARVVDDKGTHVIAQGVFWDLQKNARITYEVSRSIVYRDGSRYSADMVGVTGNAACSIALRNAILKGVPKAFWADLWGRARQVAIGDAKTLVERRTNAFKKLAQLNVSAEMILAKIKRASEADVTLEDLEVLLGIFQALKEGDSTIEEQFPSVAPALTAADTGAKAKGVDKVVETLKAKAPVMPAKSSLASIVPGPTGPTGPTANDPPFEESFAEPDGRQPGADLFAAPTFAAVMDAINKAQSVDFLDLAADVIRSVKDEGQRAELDVACRARRKELKN